MMPLEMKQAGTRAVFALAVIGLTSCTPTSAVAQITMDQAQMAVDAAEAEARANRV